MAADYDFMIEKRGQQLEDAFFLKEDMKLIEQLREMKELEETKEALSQASGITDDAILQKLVDLNIHAEMVTAMAAVPLVMVAWADGRLDDNEKTAVLHGAHEAGLGETSPGYMILQQWLTHKPGDDLLDAWIGFTRAICEALDEPEQQALKADLLQRARNVAEASGGFLGLTSAISDSEKDVLAKLKAAFVK